MKPESRSIGMSNGPLRESITQSAVDHVTALLTAKLPAQYVYHTIYHTAEIAKACEEIGQGEGLPLHDIQNAVLASLFLHSGLIHSDAGKSADIAEEFLEAREYPVADIKRVVDCIRSVNSVQNPQSQIEQVLCDADSLHLGKKKYFERSELLRVELESVAGKALQDYEWMQSRVQELTQPFFTDYANRKYGKRRSENLVIARRKLRPLVLEQERVNARATRKELLRAKPEGALKADRGADTVFRLVNRTNTTLVALADKKASVMIQTNSIILSITVSVLVKNLHETPHFAVPTGILIVSCLTTIVLAILATRPRLGAPKHGSRNGAHLLFFGNFFRMDFKHYETQMAELISNGESLYGSLIEDAYNVGQVLGMKYRLIRACYDVFMYGLILSVLSFAVAYAVHR